MATQTMTELVASLSPKEQEAVRALVEYIRSSSSLSEAPQSQSPFIAAAQEFIRQHPDLLQRLAQ